ncbi:MAG: ABC transporter permease [Bdellovibrionaceae bacterium]|nr:ABC transporter permease [Pseudobdellovibrionaceae bacterium]
MEQEPLLRVRGLKKVYRPAGQEGGFEVKALDHVDLDILPGEYISIMGPSGSGKSTLMQILGLLDRPSEGLYLLDGNDVSNLSDDDLAQIRSRKLGFIFQFFNLLPRTSCLDNVSLPLVYTGEQDPAPRARELLTQVGLADRLDHKPHQLSGGQQQRVAIARALVNHPKIIFADEPTGNISTQQTEEVLNMLEELNRRGVTIVLVTHEPEVAHHARRSLVLRDGRIAEDKLLRDRTSGALLEGDRAPLAAAAENGHGLWARVRENVRMALVALRLNLLRTSLATLGIVIGIASFVAMMAIGEGAKEAVSDLLSSMGTNLLNIRPVNPRTAKELAGDNFRKFYPEDLEALKVFAQSQPSIAKVDGQIYGYLTASHGSYNTPVEVIGATPAIETMQAFKPVAGRFFTEEENDNQARVVLIGQTVAKNMFGDKNPVGAFLKLNRVDFEIIGLLPPKGSTNNRDRDEMVLLPLKTVLNRIYGRSTLHVLTVEAVSREAMGVAQERLRQWMRDYRQQRPGDQDTFDILNMNDIQEVYNQTTGIISSMLQAISFVSLLVGGTGIMNVMFVSVKERTREVGLRKAVGARRFDILMQFMIESVLICLLGGAFGTLLGWGLSLAASSLLGWKTVFTAGAVATSFLFAFLVGVIFGLWPARQASELAPIEALRYE